MRTIILLVLTLSAWSLAGQTANGPKQPSVREKQEMLVGYLSTRVINGIPANPAAVVLCSSVTGIPVDSAFKAMLTSHMGLGEVVVRDCTAIGDVDSLTRGRTRPLLMIQAFEVKEREVTIRARVARSGGHEEVARFKRDLGWVLESITLANFWES